MTTKKTKIHKLCTTQLFYKKYSKLLSITSKLVSSHRSSRYHCSFTHSLISPSSSKYATTIASGGIFLIRNKDLSYRHSPWRALNVKPFPSQPKATRARAEHPSKFKSRDGGYLDRLGGGEPKAKRKHCTRTPFVRFFLLLSLVWFTTVSGRESYMCTRCSRNREVLGHTDTNTTQQAITSISMTSHWPTPLRFM